MGGGYDVGMHAEAEQKPAGPMNPPPRNVNIKTKFPVARIKRIMQADEDVGKVAQVRSIVPLAKLELKLKLGPLSPQ